MTIKYKSTFTKISPSEFIACKNCTTPNICMDLGQHPDCRKGSKNKKTYSSKTVKELMENNRWNFWKKDWSERIIVQWDGDNKYPLKKFSKQIVELLGRNFVYEMALNSEPTQYIVTDKGLSKFLKKTKHG